MQIREKIYSLLRGSAGSARTGSRSAMVVERVEPRILHSADPAAVFGSDAPLTAQFEQRVIGARPEPGPIAGAQTEQMPAHELVFIDPRTPDYQQLVNDIRSETAAGRNIEVVLLDGRSDGIAQISACLSGRSDIGAIHIISHGSNGVVQIGSSLLDAQTLSGYESALHSWSAALAPGADLLIYGCDVAGTEAGRALVNNLSRLTGADVAASDNLTGNAVAGGDWKLEYATGKIQTAVAIDAQLEQSWMGTLAISQDAVSSATTGATASTTLSFAHTVGTGTDRILLVELAVKGNTGATSVTYGGNALTKLATVSSGGNPVTSELWYLKAPATGTANIVITLPALAVFDAGGTSYFGVDQSSPLSAAITATGSGGTPSVTIASAPGQLVVDAAAVHAASASTVGPGQTQSWSLMSGVSGSDVWGASSTEPGAASVTMSWTTSGSGAGEWTSIAAALKPSVNSAPVLSGANDLGAISEDSATNPGTLVSALITGHVSDANVGALSGIAVTAVDNTNGAWQYSIDNGSSWNNFGTPSAVNARLLAGDTNTYVRFVPNADFNGTVTNGLTFRAWDQTSGINGGTADTSSVTNTVLDQFNAVSYSNNDGSASWSAGWVDSDGNASGGDITVSGGQLRFSVGLGASDSIYREANLTGATSATLSFSYNSSGLLGGSVSLQASNGGSYTTLTTFSSSSGAGNYSADISAYISGTTRIRFAVSGGLLAGNLQVDDVQIAYSTPLNGGTSAFSAATASSSIAVSAVNDAPALAVPGAISVTEDVASALTSISFSDIDAGGASVLATFSVPQGTLAAISGGGVTVGGNATALTLSGSIANINAFIAASSLTYTSALNDTSAVTLGVSIDDQGNSGSGGALSVAASVTLNVTAVNDAPTGTNKTVSTAEDTPYVFSTVDFGFSDPGDSPANALLAVKVASLPGAGTLSLSGAAVSAGQFISAADITAGNLVFTPSVDANGSGYASFTFQVQDDGGIANGGIDLDPVARTLTFDVTAVNDAPALSVPAAQTVATNGQLIFSSAGGNGITIGDVDGGSGAELVSLSVTNGTLTLASTAGLAFASGTGTADASMSFTGTLAAINAALDGMRFDPTASFSGSAGLGIAVNDQGNTGAGGAQGATGGVGITVQYNAPAISTTGAALSYTENDPAAAIDGGLTLTAGTQGNLGGATVQLGANYVNGQDILGFTDQLGISGSWDAATGKLTLSGSAAVADYQTALRSVSYQNTSDDPSTANRTVTFSIDDGISIQNAGRQVGITAINDGPALSVPASLAVTEDVASAITGISFSDVDAGGASVVATFSVTQGTLAAVSGGGVTVGGSATALTLNGSIADINGFLAASNLSYTTAPNDSSTVVLGVDINDLGNTGGGGAKSAAGSVTLNVSAVNDAPAGTNNTVSTAEDTAYVFSTTDFGFSDANDSPPDTLLAVEITSVPGAGTLTLGGSAVSAGQFVSATDISLGNLVFSPAADANGSGYASFTFQVQDNGGIAGGGIDVDPVARTLTIDVSAVNDAPAAAVPGAQSVSGDSTLVFSAAGGNAVSISDPDAGAAAVQVSLSVLSGTLSLSGTAGLAFITGTGSGDASMTFSAPIAAINAALDGLTFTPGSGFVGSTLLSVSVNDLGNTGAGIAGSTNGSVVIAVLPPVVSVVPSPPVVSAPGAPGVPGTPVELPGAAIPGLAGTPGGAGPVASPPATSAAADGTAASEPGATEEPPGSPADSTSNAPAAPSALVASSSQQASTSGRLSNGVFGGHDLRLLLATTETPEAALADYALTSQDSPYANQIALASLHSTDLLNELDRLRDGLQEESKGEAHAIALTTAATLGLSVGYVFWLLRGGILLSTVLSSMPAWRMIDPLPILGRLEDEADDESDPDESLESLVARKNRAAGAAVPGAMPA